jgi:RNA polymerase sigma factor for flagellar operon FliA
VGGAKQRVMVVDDDRTYLRAIRRLVGSSTDHLELTLLSDGETALDHVARNGADLAIVDLYMPGIDGMEVCRRLRATSRDTFLVLATCEPLLVFDGAEIVGGFDRLIGKPYVLAPLLVELERWRESARRVDGYSREELITAHLSLAANVARRLARRYRGLFASDDVEAIARVGLCEAAARFDPRRGQPFLPFAETRIRGAVMDEVRRCSGFTQSGSTQRRHIKRVRRDLEHTPRDHDADAVASALGVSLEVVRRVEAPTRVVLESSSRDAASSAPNSEALVRTAELLVLLDGARAQLQPLEANVVEMRYELEMPFAAIARTLGVKLADVHRVHERTLSILRRRLGG